MVAKIILSLFWSSISIAKASLSVIIFPFLVYNDAFFHQDGYTAFDAY